MRLAAAFALICLLPGAALAVGPEETIDSPPPPPDCSGGQVRDAETGACVDAQSRRLDDGERMRALRAYAHAGALDEAERVLSAMDAPDADAALTYRGFLARSRGDADAARAWYAHALALNPDNLMARAYLGMGLVAQGDAEGARVQLSQIRARGGRGSWPELALRLALESGAPTRW